VRAISQDLNYKDYDRLLMVSEIYQFAFGYSYGTITDEEIREHLILQIQREDHAMLLSEIRSLASQYQKTFNLGKLFIDRGSRSLEALYYQRIPSKHTIHDVQGNDDDENEHSNEHNSRQKRHNNRSEKRRQYTVGRPVYFSLPQESLQALPLDSFDLQLFIYLYHTFEVGWQVVQARDSQ